MFDNLNKFKLIKSATWRNEWNNKYFAEGYAPWLKDGIYAVANIGVEILT